MSSIELPRIRPLFPESRRFKLIRDAKVLALWAISAVMFLSAFACAGDEDDSSSEPTATPETVSPTSTQVATSAPTAVPTESLSPASLAATATVEADIEAAEEEATNGDEVLAAAFESWGSTCLNDAYLPNAPQLDDVAESEFSTDPNGLEFVTISAGDGEKPELSWEVEVQYTGWLDDGCIFDSSYTRSEPTVFPVNGVIPGWQMTITQMQIGERRRVVIPPDLAYGVDGSPPVIPGNATLTFDIILIDGTDPELANAVATQTAGDLLLQATAEAADHDAEVYEPIVIDYVQDVKGFLASMPQGEVTCMTAYAGSIENVETVFSGQQRPSVQIIDLFDECMSDNTTRNVAAGRIMIINPDLSEETISCIGARLKSPTLKPLFGIFDEGIVSEEWISSHFCLDADERLVFEEALYGDQPDREPGEAGKTFIDVQECMVDKLGAERYFAPVQQPNVADAEAMGVFYTNFTAFMIADVGCRASDDGYELSNGITMTEESATCVADQLGDTLFGQVLLDRNWVPTVEEHLEVAAAYNGCGAAADFLALPSGVDDLDAADLSCVLTELDNSQDPAESSLRAFSEMGSISDIKAGDLVTLLYASEKCDVQLPGIPEGSSISDSVAMCITGKIDDVAYTQGRAGVMPLFEGALQDSAECFAGQ